MTTTVTIELIVGVTGLMSLGTLLGIWLYKLNMLIKQLETDDKNIFIL